MLRNLNQSQGSARILGTSRAGIIAAQIAADTATGDNGAGLLYNESQQAEYAGKYLRCWITAKPATGTVFVSENGAVEAVGLADGLNTISYQLYVDGVLQPGTADATITVGTLAVDATAAGATLTGSATISAGVATGEVNAAAPGASLSSNATLTPGAAQAINGGSAPGAAITGTATLTPGAATGQASAAAPGSSLTGSASITPGSASGDLHASAPGITLTGSASLIAGHATNGEAISTLSAPRLRALYAWPQSRRQPAESTFRRPRNVQR